MNRRFFITALTGFFSSVSLGIQQVFGRTKEVVVEEPKKEEEYALMKENTSSGEEALWCVDGHFNGMKFLSFDFNTVLGDTVKEKVEALHGFIFKIGIGPNITIIAAPEISAVFECCCQGFHNHTIGDYHDNRFLIDCGRHGSFHVYKQDKFPVNQMLLVGDNGVAMINLI